MIVQQVEVQTDLTDLTVEEATKYIEYVKLRVGDVEGITISGADDGKVDVHYLKHLPPFERIRRITGYLTGDLRTWNNAKRSEEKERVKHDGLRADIFTEE